MRLNAQSTGRHVIEGGGLDSRDIGFDEPFRDEVVERGNRIVIESHFFGAFEEVAARSRICRAGCLIEHLAVAGIEAVELSIPAEGFSGRTGVGREGAHACRVRGQGNHGVGHRLGIAGWVGNAILAIAQVVGDATGRGGNDGEAGGHGFQDDEAQRLGEGREHEGVGAGVEGRELGPPVEIPEEDDALGGGGAKADLVGKLVEAV